MFSKLEEPEFLEQIARISSAYHLRKVAVFGSAVRDDFSEQSDVDFLIVLHPDHVPAFGFFRMVDQLRELTDREVDVVTYESLSPHLREQILNEAVVIYQYDDAA